MVNKGRVQLDQPFVETGNTPDAGITTADPVSIRQGDVQRGDDDVGSRHVMGRGTL